MLPITLREAGNFHMALTSWLINGMQIRSPLTGMILLIMISYYTHIVGSSQGWCTYLPTKWGAYNDYVLPLKSQIYPKKGFFPLYSYFGDGIGTLNPILGFGFVGPQHNCLIHYTLTYSYLGFLSFDGDFFTDSNTQYITIVQHHLGHILFQAS